MGFVTAIAAFYTRAFDFQGRSMRSEFWWTQLYLVVLVLGILLGFAWLADAGKINKQSLVAILLILCLVGMFNTVPAMSQIVRRFHDQDKSGLMLLLSYIPLIGVFIVIYYMFLPGTDGPNIYGEDPKGGIDPLTF